MPQPPKLTYDDFRKGTDFSVISSKTIISSSQECFTQCKNLLNIMRTDGEKGRVEDEYKCMGDANITQMTKVCVGNSLYLLKLSNAIAKGDIGDSGSSSSEKGRNPLTLDFKSHMQFCTIQLSL